MTFDTVESHHSIDGGLGTRLINACVAVTGRNGLIRLVVSLECFIEITPDFLCPFELHAQ